MPTLYMSEQMRAFLEKRGAPGRARARYPEPSPSPPLIWQNSQDKYWPRRCPSTGRSCPPCVQRKDFLHGRFDRTRTLPGGSPARNSRGVGPHSAVGRAGTHSGCQEEWRACEPYLSGRHLEDFLIPRVSPGDGFGGRATYKFMAGKWVRKKKTREMVVVSLFGMCCRPFVILPLNLLSILAPYLLDVIRARCPQQLPRRSMSAPLRKALRPHNFALRSPPVQMRHFPRPGSRCPSGCRAAGQRGPATYCGRHAGWLPCPASHVFGKDHVQEHLLS